MDFKFTVGAQVLIQGTLDEAALREIIRGCMTAANALFRTTALTVDQVVELLKRVHPRSREFLTVLGRQEGAITWEAMKRIFEIETWEDYSKTYGRGMTRAVRSITGVKDANLVFWNEDEWADDNDIEGLVYIDGPTLDALKTNIPMTSHKPSGVK